ncbi:hypothetical protein V5E97_06770 [Singulisphaera sp. Ch08]|uniref:Major capsid protein n=1 Tax=Singulisphaera sp. Ch08 TaxID=3120278 RepID=A0AAU7CKH0_9BACT
MPALVYPETKHIEEIEQTLLPRLTIDSPIFKYFPFDSDDNHLIEWEQLDNYTGLQQLRGYNGLPMSVPRIGSKRYRAEPGVYGEFIPLDEEEMTRRRRRATYSSGPIKLNDLVAEAFKQLLTRRLNLVEKIVWDLLIAGTFSVAHPTTGVTYSGSYTPPQFTPSPLWSPANKATAAPLAGMRTFRDYGVGQSCSFGGNAVQFYNSVTARSILANTNADDLGGVLLGGGNTVNSLNNVNEVLIMNDIPKIVIYDEGYIDANGTFQYFIPTGKGLVIGKRKSGVALGRYRYTQNVNSPNGAPKPYSRVIIKGDKEIPASVEVHDGHNGGPLIQFPGSVIVVNAYVP